MFDFVEKRFLVSRLAGSSRVRVLAARVEKVALIESGLLGDPCANHGWTPTKTPRKSARVARMARRAGDFSIQIGEVDIDFAAAVERMQQLGDGSRAGLGNPSLDSMG